MGWELGKDAVPTMPVTVGLPRTACGEPPLTCRLAWTSRTPVGSASSRRWPCMRGDASDTIHYIYRVHSTDLQFML